ncbi:MAG: DUF2723 domain-containing protein [Phycisphaerae bacterium]
MSTADKSAVSAARPPVAGLWFLVFVAAAAMYMATAQRGTNWQDSGARQWRIVTGQYTDPLGLALAHPLFIAVGRQALHVPMGDVLSRLNCISALAMAVALANLAAVVTLLTGRRWAGLASAGMLAVCHTAWWLSTITEVYTLQLAAMSGELWLLVLLVRNPRWYYVAALAGLNGLDLAVHDLALLPLPVYLIVAIVLVVRRRVGWGALAAGAVAYLAGASLYLTLIVREALSTGHVGQAIASALFGQYEAQVLNVLPAWSIFKQNAGLAAMNFGSFIFLLAVAGWVRMRREGGMLWMALTAITAIEVVFVARYSIPDQFTFFLPSLLMIALASGVGAAYMAGRSLRWAKAVAFACVISIVLPPVMYYSSPHLLAMAGIAIHRRKLPFRDEARYWMVPWKQDESSADQFAVAALLQAQPDAVVFLDGTTLYPLKLKQRLEGLSPDVTLTDGGEPMPSYESHNSEFRQVLGNRPLLVVTPQAGYVPEKLLSDAEFVRRDGQVLYQARWKQPATSVSP